MIGAEPLRVVLPPLVSAFALFVSVLVYATRHPAPRPRRGPRSATLEWRRFVRHVALTTLGGYACFLLVVSVFHVLIAGQRGALVSAVWGGAFLSFGVAAPMFLLLGANEHRRRRPRRRC